MLSSLIFCFGQTLQAVVLSQSVEKSRKYDGKSFIDKLLCTGWRGGLANLTALIRMNPEASQGS